ncbi:MAG: S1C family serine protease [Porcipelethomonas sp.]
MDELNNNINDETMLPESTTDTAADENTENISQRFSDIENDILQNAGKITKKRKHSIPGRTERIILIVLSVLILAAVCAASVYCICSDIADSNNNLSMGVSGRPDFVLDAVHRPDDGDEFIDENGKYTIEGIAKAIRPQVVEIYVYADKNSDTITGGGSGIIISEDGYIVTNAHVLDGMEKYMVTTHDGRSYQASITGKDKKTDIAVIKVAAQGLSPAQFGNSDEVIQGETVVAIGNPAGLSGSITDGIVSGLNRKIKTDTTGFEMNCIQTDAAISPGNSGGALVNMYGQVIGITSSKYATTTTEGLGFAITINDARPIIEELISQGYVSGRVKIGITFYSTYANYAAIMFEDKFGFEIPDELKEALWIEEISEDCDISNTELEPYDFIVSFEGKKMSDYSSLSDAISGKKGGDTVKAECARVSPDGKISYFDIEFKLMTDTSGDY